MVRPTAARRRPLRIRRPWRRRSRGTAPAGSRPRRSRTPASTAVRRAEQRIVALASSRSTPGSGSNFTERPGRGQDASIPARWRVPARQDRQARRSGELGPVAATDDGLRRPGGPRGPAGTGRRCSSRSCRCPRRRSDTDLRRVAVRRALLRPRRHRRRRPDPRRGSRLAPRRRFRSPTTASTGNDQLDAADSGTSPEATGLIAVGDQRQPIGELGGDMCSAGRVRLDDHSGRGTGRRHRIRRRHHARRPDRQPGTAQLQAERVRAGVVVRVFMDE